MTASARERRRFGDHLAETSAGVVSDDAGRVLYSQLQQDQDDDDEETRR